MKKILSLTLAISQSFIDATLASDDIFPNQIQNDQHFNGFGDPQMGNQEYPDYPGIELVQAGNNINNDAMNPTLNIPNIMDNIVQDDNSLDFLYLETLNNHPNQQLQTDSRNIVSENPAQADLSQYLKNEFLQQSQKELDQGIEDMKILKDAVFVIFLKNVNDHSIPGVEVKPILNAVLKEIQDDVKNSINELKVYFVNRAKKIISESMQIPQSPKRYIADPQFVEIKTFMNGRDVNLFDMALPEELQALRNELEKEFREQVVAFTTQTWVFMNSVVKELEEISRGDLVL